MKQDVCGVELMPGAQFPPASNAAFSHVMRSSTSTTLKRHGGSITGVKQRRIVFAARHYLNNLRTLPPCRFDVVLVEERITWLQGAFDAGGN